MPVLMVNRQEMGKGNVRRRKKHFSVAFRRNLEPTWRLSSEM